MSGKNKTILITGASSGIGEALAKHYARDGVFLALGGRNEDRLQEVAAFCRNKGADVEIGVVDVADRDAMNKWICALDDSHSLDLVIANAGISGGTGGAQSFEPLEQVRYLFDINLTGVLNTIDPVLPRMTERRAGQIALMSSLASFSGWAGAPAYSASKGAVRLYGEALRGSMADTGVKINVICPGFIKTPLTDVNEYYMPFMMDAERSANMIAKGLAKNRGRIAFPWQTYALAGFFGLLPQWLSGFIFSKLPGKPQSAP